MFKSQDEYTKATQHAQVNTYDEHKSVNAKQMVLNLVLLSSLASFAFFYTKTNLLSDLLPHKTAVLGVSLTVDDESTDQDYLRVLDSSEVDSVEEGSSLDTLNSSMKLLMNEPSIQSQSFYTHAISRELEDNDDSDDRDYRVVIVKKGDTLSNLSEKYYGSARGFNKIVKSNKHLKEQSHTLYVGEKINIPY